MSAKRKDFAIESPHIDRIYLERVFGQAGHGVLVIETDIPLRELKSGARNDQLEDLLLGLDQVKARAGKVVGPFERIDIRFR